MTIFGFNTDIKYGDTIYHVQSEQRRHDSLLQTQVFVRGRCIGKHSSSYTYLKDGASANDSAIDEARAHELLKEQHRTIVEAVRAGKVEEVLSQTLAAPENSSTPTPAPTQSQPLAQSAPSAGAAVAAAPSAETPQAETLELRFVNPESILQNHSAIFRFTVTQSGVAVADAKVVCRLQSATLSDGTEPRPIYSQSVTSADGHVEISFAVDESALHQASVLVQASHGGKLCTRKFRLKGK